MKKYLLILFALFIAAGCSNNDSSNSGTNPATSGKTTVLMYIVGTTFEHPDNTTRFFKDAYDEGIKQDALGYGPANYMIKEMIENLNPENTNIVIQTGSTDAYMKWTDKEILAKGADPEKFYIKDWYQANRWQITKDEGLKPLETKGDVCRDGNNTNCVNIASGETIGDFLTYGVQNYPADRYIVIFFSHGGGSILGFGSGTTLPEMQKAFNMAKTETNAEFDIIGFAACLMGNAEWMHGLSDYGKYYVASEESEIEFPWLLGDITSGIAQNYTTEQLLDTITSTYYKYSARDGIKPTNISAIDLKEVKALSSALGELSNKIAEDYQANSVKTFNNFYVALSRSDTYGKGLFGLYDLQAVINSLDETTWYGLDYSSYNQKITDIISKSVKINKSSPLLSESYGISFYAPNYGQAYDPVQQHPLSKYVLLYKTLVPDFSPEYVKMLETITQYADNNQTIKKVGNIKKEGTNVLIDYTSNFAPSYNSTLELIRQYDDGTTRIGTVAGDYTITTADTANSDEIKYTIKVDTGLENINDANLFTVAPYGKTGYNPIRVQIKNSIDSAKPAYSTGTTKFKLTRDNNDYELIAHFLYGKDDETGEFQIINPTFELKTDTPSELQKTFTFQKDDIVTIPDYSSEVTAKAANNLPTYQITCESANCLQFDIVPLRAEETPQFRFVIPNIKNETYITPQQTIN